MQRIAVQNIHMWGNRGNRGNRFAKMSRVG